MVWLVCNASLLSWALCTSAVNLCTSCMTTRMEARHIVRLSMNKEMRNGVVKRQALQRKGMTQTNKQKEETSEAERWWDEGHGKGMSHRTARETLRKDEDSRKKKHKNEVSTEGTIWEWWKERAWMRETETYVAGELPCQPPLRVQLRLASHNRFTYMLDMVFSRPMTSICCKKILLVHHRILYYLHQRAWDLNCPSAHGSWLQKASCDGPDLAHVTKTRTSNNRGDTNASVSPWSQSWTHQPWPGTAPTSMFTVIHEGQKASKYTHIVT